MEVSSLPVLIVGLQAVPESKTDVAHTLSDMHTHNVASQIPCLDSWTVEKFLRDFRRAGKEPNITMRQWTLGSRGSALCRATSLFLESRYRELD